jgi:tetratricopeptide (TPR) repeat protein
VASPSLYLKKARELEAKKDWDKAIAEYKRILETESGASPALFNLLGDLYAKKSDLEQAFKNYERAIELYCEETLYNNAIALCKKCLRVDPHRVEIYNRLGGLYASQGLVHEAIRFLTDYAERKREMNDARAVETTWKRIIDIAPSNEALRSKSVEVFLEIKKPRAAVEALTGLADILRKKGAHDEAKAAETRAAEIMVAAPFSEPDPGVVSVPQELVDQIEDVIKIDWNELGALAPLSAHPSDGSDGEAAPPAPPAAARPRVEIPPDALSGTVSIKDRAQQEDDLVDLNEVLDEFRSGVAQVLRTEDYQGHYDLGMSYKEMELFDDAIEAFRAASQDADLRVAALEMIADCLMEKGEVREVVTLITGALDGQAAAVADDVGLRYLLGNAYLRLNDREQARACYEQVAALDPSFRDTEERLKHLREYVR